MVHRQGVPGIMWGLNGAAPQIREDLDKIVPKELKFPLVILGGIQVQSVMTFTCVVIR